MPQCVYMYVLGEVVYISVGLVSEVLVNWWFLINVHINECIEGLLAMSVEIS